MLSHGSLFSGTGLLDYGLMLAGLDEPLWVAEWDEWRREHILAKRFPRAVRYDDVRAVGATCEHVDLMAGGFPCKGASSAGPRNGFDHPETVLWREFRRAISEIRPRYVLVENVANILGIHRGAVWGEVLGDLASLGYDTVWDCIPAAAVGAPHRRDRVFAIASYTDGTSQGRERGQRGQQNGRSDARGGGVLPALNPQGERGETGPPQGEELGRAPSRRAGALADAGCKRGERRGGCRDLDGPSREAQGEARQRQRRGDASDDRGGAASPDSGRQRLERESAEHGEESSLRLADAQRRGIRVEWGKYEPAIRRWEAIAGSAPEPLLRRVDDRATARVERSRLSALGDGVQVQVGAIVGAYILEQERALTRS